MLYHFEISLSDVDRGIYQNLDFRISQHPSENHLYLMTRALAYPLSYQEGLEFSAGGLADPQTVATDLIEAVPSLLAASAQKLRILGRIANGFTDQSHATTEIIKTARRLDRMQLDQLVAIHYLEGQPFNSIQTLRRALDTANLTKESAQQLLASTSESTDPVIQLYHQWRGASDQR